MRGTADQRPSHQAGHTGNDPQSFGGRGFASRVTNDCAYPPATWTFGRRAASCIFPLFFCFTMGALDGKARDFGAGVV